VRRPAPGTATGAAWSRRAGAGGARPAGAGRRAVQPASLRLAGSPADRRSHGMTKRFAVGHLFFQMPRIYSTWLCCMLTLLPPSTSWTEISLLVQSEDPNKSDSEVKFRTSIPFYSIQCRLCWITARTRREKGGEANYVKTTLHRSPSSTMVVILRSESNLACSF
jgi:hypothetical protein